MDFFAVEKYSDIRLVYNGMSCGLNEALWAPNFWLPLPSTAAVHSAVDTTWWTLIWERCS
jgi:hypothetical protein